MPEPGGAASSAQQGGNDDSGKHLSEGIIIKAFVIMAIIVILGLLLAVAVVKFSKGGKQGNNEIREYNGFQFVKIGNTWFTQWSREGVVFNLEFRHPPWDVENISVNGNVDARFQRDFMFMTHDPTDNASRQTAFVAVASADLTSVLTNIFDKKGIVPACTANITESCHDRPIATCSTNASVIYVKVSSETGIFLDGNCVTFQGTEENLTKAVDKGIYQWLNIIK